MKFHRAPLIIMPQHGAEIAAMDANGDIPLNWASWHWHPRDILEKLRS